MNGWQVVLTAFLNETGTKWTILSFNKTDLQYIN